MSDQSSETYALRADSIKSLMVVSQPRQHRRGQKMSMVKKGLAKIIRPVNISYHLKECQMAQALSKNTADATKV